MKLLHSLDAGGRRGLFGVILSALGFADAACGLSDLYRGERCSNNFFLAVLTICCWVLQFPNQAVTQLFSCCLFSPKEFDVLDKDL